MSEPASFQVFVAENSAYMDDEARRLYGTFDDGESALAACRAIVDRSLAEHLEAGMSAARLLELYKMFGEDASIVGDRSFSSWDYAATRAEALCRSDGAVRPGRLRLVLPDRELRPGAAVVNIGRSGQNDLRLLDPLASQGTHCVIFPDDNGYRLVDNQTANGTYVNGARVGEHVLRAGDVIQIGTTRITVEEIDERR